MWISAQRLLIYPCACLTLIPALKMIREGVFSLTGLNSECSQTGRNVAELLYGPIWWAGSRAPKLWRCSSSFLCVILIRTTKLMMTLPNLVSDLVLYLRKSSLEILFKSHLRVWFRDILNASQFNHFNWQDSASWYLIVCIFYRWGLSSSGTAMLALLALKRRDYSVLQGVIQQISKIRVSTTLM